MAASVQIVILFVAGIVACLDARPASDSISACVPRMLAGSPAEFSFFQTPVPEDAALSSSVLTSVAAEINQNGNSPWRHQVVVDSCQILTFTVIYGETATISLSAINPSGQTVAPKFEVQEEFGINTGDMYPSRSIAFESPASGKWTVVLESSQATKAYVIASVTGAKSQLWGTVQSESLLVGNTVGLKAKMQPNPEVYNVSSFSFKDAVTEADLTVTLPGGAVVFERMEESANSVDNMYEGQLFASQPGTYNAKIDFEGVHTDTGEPFVRSMFYMFAVVEPAIKIALEPAIAEMYYHNVMETDIVNIDIAVQWDQGSQTKFRGFTEVWGTSDEGEVVPVAWLSGILPIQSSNRFASTQYFLRFELHVSWLDIAKAGLPLFLRNTNFDDITAFVTLSGVDSLKVTTTDANLLKRRWKPHSSDDISYEMQNGFNPHRYRRTNVSAEPGKIVLVHGYCAKETPFDTAYYTDFVNLEDFDQNRPNSDFAESICKFVEEKNIEKFSLVSHSQGGFASLHLYTYYGSGADLTGEGRKLQSLGTPYHGQALAGVLADIGKLLGMLCGSNDDLTYDGAERWLSEIPPSKREEVYYYVTQYGDGGLFGSYCVFGAGALLGHPNDGLVTISKTILEYGHSQSVYVGECHSVGMHYPPQCKNAERAKEINENAAR